MTLSIACLSLIVPSSASAFCRTTTAPAPPSNGDACVAAGAPLFHRSQCLPYQLTAAESAVVPNAVLAETLARAFQTWTKPNALCVPGIRAVELGASNQSTIAGHQVSGPNQNLVGFPATWAHAGSADTLAFPTLTFNATTGEILDVDLELNRSVAWSFADEPAGDRIDLQSVLTHAVGHMLGLAHSSVPTSAMYPTYAAGSTTPRTLDADDEAAICAVYPNRDQRLAASGLVASTGCNLTTGDPNGSCSDPDITHGCASAARGTRTGSSLGIGIVAALALLGMRRRRR